MSNHNESIPHKCALHRLFSVDMLNALLEFGNTKINIFETVTSYAS